MLSSASKFVSNRMSNAGICEQHSKPEEFKKLSLERMKKFVIGNNTNNQKIRKYVELSGNTNIKIKYDQYKNYMYCKYYNVLCRYAIDHKKINVLKWALNNNFNYSYKDCEIAINNNFPEALEEILKKNVVEKWLEKKEGFVQTENIMNVVIETIETKLITNKNIIKFTEIIKKRLMNCIDNPRNRTFSNEYKKNLKDILNKYLPTNNNLSH